MTDVETSGRSRAFLAVLLLGVLGSALSVILTVHHMELKVSDALGVRAGESACNINATFNCDLVARSSWSEFLGFPLGAWGLAFFLSVCIAAVVGMRSNRADAARLADIWLVISSIGVLCALALFLISKLQIGSYCVYCIGVYLCTALVWLVLLVADRSRSFFTRIRSGLSGLVAAPLRIFGAAHEKSSNWWAVICGGLLIVIAFMTPSFIGARLEQKLNASAAQKMIQPDGPLQRWQNSPVEELDLDFKPGVGVDHSKGNSAGRVRIVEFIDFECPACRVFTEALDRILEAYRDEVHVVIKNYPLDKRCNPAILRELHPNACFFAELARCAGEQGQYFDAMEFIFGVADMFDDPEEARQEARAVTDALGLDSQGMESCLSSGRQLSEIQDDIRQANALEIGSTPTVFIDGKRLPVADPALVDAILRSALTR